MGTFAVVGFTVGGTIVGIILGYFFGKWKMLFSFDSASYDCEDKEITVNASDASDLHRVYGVAVNGSPITTLRPSGDNLVEQDHDGSATFTLHHEGWPNSGDVGFTVWGATFKKIVDTEPCGSGSGSTGFFHVLRGRVDLEITIPDGPLQGIHQAKAVGELKWEFTVDSTTFTLTTASVDTLRVESGSRSVESSELSPGPFSVSFPGDIFQATTKVVVMKS